MAGGVLEISYVRTPAWEMHVVPFWGAVQWYLGPWWTDLDAQGLFLRRILHASACMMLFPSSFPDEESNTVTEFLTTCIFMGISVSL